MIDEKRNPESAALRPVIYELGVVVYVAQQFETNLLFLICLAADRGGLSTKEAFVNAFGTQSEKTLGQLAKVLRTRLTIPGNYEAFLREGIDARNKIVHGFVLRNTEKFWTVKGREELIDELREAQHIIAERLEAITEVLDVALKVFGKGLAEIRKEAEFRFEPTDFGDPVRH